MQGSENFRAIHHLSSPDSHKLLEWIDRSVDELPVEVKSLTQELEMLTRKRQKAESSLSRVPPDEVLHPLMQELNQIHSRLGGLIQRTKILDEEIRQVQFKYDEVCRQLKKQEEQQKEFAGTKLQERACIKSPESS